MTLEWAALIVLSTLGGGKGIYLNGNRICQSNPDFMLCSSYDFMGGGVYALIKSLGWISNYQEFFITEELEDDDALGLSICCRV